MFQIFDKNGDDKISTTELGAVLSKLGQDPPDDKIQEMITEYDIDGRQNEIIIVICTVFKVTCEQRSLI